MPKSCCDCSFLDDIDKDRCVLDDDKRDAYNYFLQGTIPCWCPIKPVWCTTGFYTQAIESRQIESREAITERGKFKICQEIGENLLKGGFIDFAEYDSSSAGEIVTKGTVMFIAPTEREWLKKELLKGGASDEESKG